MFGPEAHALAGNPEQCRAVSRSYTKRDPAALRRHLEAHGVAINHDGFLTCPAHADRHPSCHLYDGYEGGHLHCFACGYHADAFTYLTTHGGLTRRQAVEALDGAITTPTVGLRMRVSQPLLKPALVGACPTTPLEPREVEAHDHRAAALKHIPAVLDGRGFTLEDLRILRIASEGSSAIIPITGPSGQVLRLKARKLHGRKGARYAYVDRTGTSTPAWCSPNVASAELVLVIEGELNGMIAWRVRPELGVVGVAGARGTLPLRTLAGRPVVLYSDGDQPGSDARARWATSLHLHRCVVSALEPWVDGDACDVAGGLGRQELAARLA